MAGTVLSIYIYINLYILPILTVINCRVQVLPKVRILKTMLAKPNTYEGSHSFCDQVIGREQMSCPTHDF